MTESLGSRLAAVRLRIVRACERAGRSSASVTLIGASKANDAETIRAAMAAGLMDFGENRVQEGVAKAALIGADGATPRWHFIGHLQTNKARAALNTFVILHSIDSERLAMAIQAAAAAPVRCLIEVNVASESAKHGVLPADLAALVASVRSLPNLGLEGFMTVAPAVADPEFARPIFRELAAMARAFELPQLSMGMTDDFEVAIEEGATMVRVGRAIFGGRPA